MKITTTDKKEEIATRIARKIVILHFRLRVFFVGNSALGIWFRTMLGQDSKCRNSLYLRPSTLCGTCVVLKQRILSAYLQVLRSMSAKIEL